ncbi:MAG: hypothetical protein JW941_03410 [Candidatus Coatesbacteria bacterium]|nr:hypothetical protein [Candidatus Coatesbacteria bacterium]
MRREILVVGFLTILIGFAGISGCLAFTDTWDELGLDFRTLVNASGTQTEPRIDFDRVVYRDESGSYWRIYYYDYRTDEIVGPVRDDGLSQQNPDIDFNQICFTERRETSGTRWVYMYDIETDTDWPVDPHEYVAQLNPRIFKGYVVWHDNRVSVSDYNIYMYDSSTDSVYPVCTTSNRQEYADIDDYRVVYQTRTYHTLPDIQMYDFNGTAPNAGSYRMICSGNWYAERPSIYERRVVWQDYRNGNYDIYMYDMDRESGDEEVEICVHSGNQEFPTIYKDFIVWKDSRTDGFGPGLYCYDLRSDQEIFLTSGSGTPAMEAAKVIWGNGDIQSAILPSYTGLHIPAKSGFETSSATKGGFHPLADAENNVKMVYTGEDKDHTDWKPAEMCYVKSITGTGYLYRLHRADFDDREWLKPGDRITEDTYMYVGEDCEAVLSFREGTEVILKQKTYLEIRWMAPWSYTRLAGIVGNWGVVDEVLKFKETSAKLDYELGLAKPDPDKISDLLNLLERKNGIILKQLKDDYQYLSDGGKLANKVPEHMKRALKSAERWASGLAVVNTIVCVVKIIWKTIKLVDAEGYISRIETQSLNPYMARITTLMSEQTDVPKEYACNGDTTQEDSWIVAMMGLTHNHAPQLQGSLMFPWWWWWDENATGLNDLNMIYYPDGEWSAGWDSKTKGGQELKFTRRNKIEDFCKVDTGSFISCVLQVVAGNINDLVCDVAGYYLPTEFKMAVKALDDCKNIAVVELEEGTLEVDRIQEAHDQKLPFTHFKFSNSGWRSRCSLLVFGTAFDAEVNDTGVVSIGMRHGEATLQNCIDDDWQSDDSCPITWNEGLIQINPNEEALSLPIPYRIQNPFVTALSPLPCEAVAREEVTYRFDFSDAMDTESVREDGLLRLEDDEGNVEYDDTIQQLIDDGILTAHWEGLTEEDDRNMVLFLTHVPDLEADFYKYTLDVTNCFDAVGMKIDDQVWELEFAVVGPVGPGGGTVATPSGVEVDIPAGALPTDEQIEITVTQEGDDFPASIHPHVFVCQFSPGGLTFDVPVTLTFPLPDGHEGSGYESIFWYNSATDEWEDLGGTIDGDVIYVEIGHFSEFSACYSDTDGEHHRPVAIASADPQKPNVGETVTLDGSASYDLDSDTLYYRWDFNANGTWDTSWSTDPTHETSFGEAGMVEVILQVKDNSNDGDAYFDSDCCRIWVETNSPPTARARTSKDEYYLNEEVVVDASDSYDDDGDELQYRWDWEADGEWDTGWSSSPYASTYYSTGGTTYVIKLQVMDEEEEYDVDYAGADIREDTYITLNSFVARQTHQGIELRWTTGTEIDTAGFNIWRSDGGEYTKINSRLIVASGSPSSGASYSYLDTTAVHGLLYKYKLEEIETNGKSNFYGPARQAASVKELLLDPGHSCLLGTDVRAENAAVR